jgi:L-amino acid N-acyltransferase YncA
MKIIVTTALAALWLSSIVSTAPAQNPSGYAGHQQRAIKALSEQEIADLKAGSGMSLALAAELNSYPGPRHVLELADKLELTAKQRSATEALVNTMSRKAQPLGIRIVEAERDLDRAFAARRITVAQLNRRVQAIAALQGKLRAAHLETHLSQRALLTLAQIARYDELRGYRSDVAPIHEGHRHH